MDSVAILGTTLCTLTPQIQQAAHKHAGWWLQPQVQNAPATKVSWHTTIAIHSKYICIRVTTLSMFSRENSITVLTCETATVVSREMSHVSANDRAATNAESSQLRCGTKPTWHVQVCMLLPAAYLQCRLRCDSIQGGLQIAPNYLLQPETLSPACTGQGPLYKCFQGLQCSASPPQLHSHESLAPCLHGYCLVAAYTAMCATASCTVHGTRLP